MQETDFAILGQVLRRLENATAHVAMDDRGVIQAWNAPAEALLGWTRHEACEQFLADLVIPEPLRARHREGLERWRTLGDAQIVCRELRTMALHKEGHEVPVLVNVQIVQDDTGTRFLGWIRAVHD